jgi:hypothetical protein
VIFKAMSDFASLVELYKNRGFSGKEDIEKAEAREREERAFSSCACLICSSRSPPAVNKNQKNN